MRRARQSGQLRIERRGLLLVLSSPSGAGKTTLAGRLIAGRSLPRMSVSVTTRAPAPGRGRRQGLHFHRSAGLRAPQAGRRPDRVGGSARQSLRHAAGCRCLRALARGRGHAVRHRLAGRAPAQGSGWAPIWWACSSCRRTASRLGAAAARRAAQDSEEVVQRRLAAAATEIAHWRDYDYVIVNADLEASLAGPAGDPGGGAPEARAADRA